MQSFRVSHELSDAAQKELVQVRERRSFFDRLGGVLRLKRAAVPASVRPRFAHQVAYYKHCKKALTQALAPHWQGSRAALKAKVREILQPRRHDTRFLSGILRATVVPAALAIFMLAANVQSAHADMQCSNAFRRYTDPFNAVDVGRYSAPAFADVDGDGDLDAFSGEQFGSIKYYKNTNTATLPVFAEQSGAANPFNGVDVGHYSAPTFSDVDGDGDLDAFIGEYFGSIKYYKNTGTANAPVFTEQTGAASPFNGVDVGFYSTPTFADVDGDGDMDAFVGEKDGNINYYQNTGTATAPVFTEQTGAANPFDGVDVGDFSSPTLVDLDGDGDADTFVGEFDGVTNYYLNTGTATAPAFTEQSGAANPFNSEDVGYNSAPAFGDVDGDGDMDVLIGVDNGNINILQNVSVHALPYFSASSASENPFSSVTLPTTRVAPSFVDIDNDGDLDAFVGDHFGFMRYYLNTGTALAPNLVQQTGVSNPFDGVDVGNYSAPAFVDIDSDGDMDAFIGNHAGNFMYFQNTGTATAPVFTGAVSPLVSSIGVGLILTPTFVDIDGDGDTDAFSGNYNGLIKYFQNTGSATSPLFVEESGANNPLNGFDVGYVSVPTFVDVDGDGDMDAFVGEQYGTVLFFENTGSAIAPVFTQQTGSANPFNGFDFGQDSHPFFADIDGDGDKDSFIAIFNAVFRYTLTNDCTAPTASCQNVTVQLDASGNATLTAAQVDNGSTDDTGIKSFALDVSTFTCADIGDVPVVLTVTDMANRTATCNATVTVQDVTPPTITLNGNASVTIDCNGAYTEDGATASDACDTNLPAVTIAGDTVDPATLGIYVITYDVADTYGNAATQVTRTVTVQDTTKPTLTLNGNSTVTIECGGTYTEAGATASDTCDTNLPAVIISGDTVDTSTPGTYNVTYDVSDASNNAATQATRTVTVQDATPPVLTLFGDSTLNFNCGDTYTEFGAIATDSCSANLSAITIAGDAVDTSTPGAYVVTYDVSDASGNAATQVTRTVNIADNCVPVCTSPGLNLVSNGGFENGTTGWTISANSGDTLNTNSPYNGTAELYLERGGSAGAQVGDFSQTINLPTANSAIVRMHVRRVQSAFDTTGTLTISMGSTTKTVNQFAIPGAFYGVIEMDISAYADDLSHDLLISFDCSAGTGASTILAFDEIEVLLCDYGVFNVDAFQFGPGGSDTVLDSTTEALGIWAAIDAGAAVPGVISANGTTYDIPDFETDTEHFINYATSQPWESINGDGPAGSGGSVVRDEFSVRAQAYLKFQTAGTFTLSVSSDDGRYIGLFPLCIGGSYSGLTPGAQGAVISPNEIMYDLITGLYYSNAVFTVDAGDVFYLRTLFFEHDGGENFEVYIKPGADTTFGGPGSGYALLQDDSFGIIVSNTNPILDCGGISSIHSADTNTNSKISLTELLRVIQFFNIGSFHCDALGEDGYNPGVGDQSCHVHSSDYNTQNWSISLPELLRVIQFFNIGAYHFCPNVGEDEYCPGP